MHPNESKILMLRVALSKMNKNMPRKIFEMQPFSRIKKYGKLPVCHRLRTIFPLVTGGGRLRVNLPMESTLFIAPTLGKGTELGVTITQRDN